MKSPPTPSSVDLAAYVGAISRWCDLTGHTPDASTGDKIALEFSAFNTHLDDLANQRRELEEIGL